MLGFAPSLRLGSGLRALASEELAEQALTVLREALSNVARHAGATRADVTVDVGQRRDPHRHGDRQRNRASRPEGRRSGLRNLADRAAELGGELRLEPGRARAPRARGPGWSGGSRRRPARRSAARRRKPEVPPGLPELLPHRRVRDLAR